MQFLSNYFTLDKRTDWGIFHYRVDFAPADIETREKKQLFRNHKDKFGGNYIFDGSSLYVSNRISPDVSDIPIAIGHLTMGTQTMFNPD